MSDRTGIELSQEIPLFTLKVRPETSLSVSITPSKGPEEDSDLSLSERLLILQTRPVEDIENSFFYCSKQYHTTFRDWQVSLQPLVAMHPLVSLYTSETGAVKEKIERKIRDLVKAELHLVHKYKWLLRVMDVMGRLAVKWRLFGRKQTEQRENCAGSLVRTKQLGECQRVQEVVFVPDVVYIAASYDQEETKLATREEQLQAATVSHHLLNLLEFLLTLNSKVDYRSNGSIADYLYAGVNTSPPALMRVVPQAAAPRHTLIPSVQKKSHALRIGFHLFERGGVLARCCSRNPVHALNRKLENLLGELVRTYVSFEQQLAKHSV